MNKYRDEACELVVDKIDEKDKAASRDSDVVEIDEVEAKENAIEYTVPVENQFEIVRVAEDLSPSHFYQTDEDARYYELFSKHGDELRAVSFQMKVELA